MAVRAGFGGEISGSHGIPQFHPITAALNTDVSCTQTSVCTELFATTHTGAGARTASPAAAVAARAAAAALAARAAAAALWRDETISRPSLRAAPRHPARTLRTH